MRQKLPDPMAQNLWIYLTFLVLIEIAGIQLLILVCHPYLIPNHPNSLNPNRQSNRQHLLFFLLECEAYDYVQLEYQCVWNDVVYYFHCYIPITVKV
jgi:hypothetical protein